MTVSRIRSEHEDQPLQGAGWRLSGAIRPAASGTGAPRLALTLARPRPPRDATPFARGEAKAAGTTEAFDAAREAIARARRASDRH